MKEDDIDARIERVINSVASKKAKMAQWENRHDVATRRQQHIKRWAVIAVTGAASIAVICGVGISLFRVESVEPNAMVSNSTQIYRGAKSDIPEVKVLIAQAKYTEALHVIDSALCDTFINPSFAPARQEYLHAYYQNQEYELTWLKIKVLYKMGKYTEAVKILKIYSEIAGEHQSDAKKLLNTLPK